MRSKQFYILLALSCSHIGSLPAQACVSSSAGFEACTGNVISLEVFENKEQLADAAGWVILSKIKCTSPRVAPALFLLASEKDARSFDTKFALSRLAYQSGEPLTLVFATTPPADYPHVVRVNVPPLDICDSHHHPPSDSPDIGGLLPVRRP